MYLGSKGIFMRSWLAMLFAVGLSAGSVAAQDFLPLAGTILHESEPDRTLISKPGWLRGLHVVGAGIPAEDRPQIWTLLPETWLGDLACARITSMSGNYVATIEFAIPQSPPTRRARLNFDTAYGDVVAAITPMTGGIALEKGACIGDTIEGRQEYAANFWNEKDEIILNDAGTAELLLNMNIARVDELLPAASLQGDGSSAPVPLATPDCTRIDSPEALAFNFRCRVFIPPQQLQDQKTAKILFSYTRLYRGRELKPRDAVIYVGAGQ